jgi:hypothetical protein
MDKSGEPPSQTDKVEMLIESFFNVKGAGLIASGFLR